MSQLHADCLNEIFEYLDNNKNTLYSCLLVNHLWSAVSVRILWRSIRNYRTLIICLPNKSKKILFENGISILTSKPLLFNYVTFCKSVSFHEIDINIERLLKKQQSISIQSSKDNITQEIFRFLMSQIISLRKLIITEFTPENKDMKFSFRHMKPFRYGNPTVPPLKTPKFSPENIMKILTELRDRMLNNLSEFYCYSDTYPEFFYRLSQICHTIQTLKISLTTENISKELIDLISVQKNLKNLYMLQLRYEVGLNDLLTRIPNTLINFTYHGINIKLTSLLVNTNLSNLQELKLYCNNYDLRIFNYNMVFDRFKNSDDSECHEKSLSNLNNNLSTNILNEFLENNGRNLKKFHINKYGYERSICTYCKNIRILKTNLTNNELDVLRNFFKAFPFLESIRICYHDLKFNEKFLFEDVVKYSPKNFHKLKLYYYNYNERAKSSLVPEELELFLASWKSRVPQKPLSLVITGYHTFIENDGNMKVIEKYTELGTIKLVKKPIDNLYKYDGIVLDQLSNRY
ncbi:hypothetical protein RhiirA5_417618 [Rhizophagus irregularis]|uniref:F-box domain-containing protein n=3 Tax=Rhizophagus irregularis TaxID=588596 RepID=A0A2N0PM20_9GLOM|nr:hypothetical protein RirG_135460 [Rhizophagus irregularis DAOM 197198w]PKC07893.1 hypothetical protein RhiirA5_417618 [Rhizophagus irregularis]UZO24520.1 hypothetical protein OCT59_016816 [Rhizophagus irregularis]GBC46078.1 hypothetical protein GLOIN_2v1774990 [Rhizophagus irregularis DAOM 181602=DAOM 197198]